MRFLIKSYKPNNKPCYIDNVVLEGDIEDLYDKMSDQEYIEKLNISADFLFQPFILVPECEVDV